MPDFDLLHPKAESAPRLGRPETKWTPGPWSAWDRGIGWEVLAGGAEPPSGRRVNDGFRDTFLEADARLIAAAPELYAALEAYELEFRAFTAPGNNVILQELGIATKAALAKARGETRVWDRRESAGYSATNQPAQTRPETCSPSTALYQPTFSDCPDCQHYQDGHVDSPNHAFCRTCKRLVFCRLGQQPPWSPKK